MSSGAENGLENGPDCVDSSYKGNGKKKDKHIYEENQEGCGCFGFYGGCLHQCRPDPDETNIIDYDNVKDRSAWFRIPRLHIRFNPLVTASAVILIWGFVAFCILEPEVSGRELKRTKNWITKTFTWLYIGSQDVWALFIVVVYVKFGHVKLGKDDSKPEFSDATWFTMLFSCGVGIGLFFFGVAEPMWHYEPAGGGNRYIADKTMPDNTLAQNAINLTLYHWGIHGWVVYCLVGMLMGIVSYRMGLPMTVKSCFYPLLGDKIFGWMGDMIDTLSIITTLFGVCTSLGFGVIQLNAGLNLLNEDIPIDKITQVIIIWCITALATVSTLTGLNFGIRRLSEICFGVGVIIMTIVLLLDNTWFVLNLYVQSIGFYIQWIFQLGFHCDAFEQLGVSYGGEARERDYKDGTTDGLDTWMDSWTVFYWGWWIAWSPFVGMFIAKISKGRTIRQFINGSMTAPILYAFFWMCIFGGIGIKMERNAAGVGLCCNNNLHNATYIQTQITTQPLGAWACEKNSCNTCAQSIINMELKRHNSSEKFLQNMKALKNNFGVQLPDRSLTRLSCHTKEQMWFDVMDSYGKLSGFLRIISVIGIILYFVTSSDSGSFVIDCLAANGDEDPPRIQRVFWALSEGATATALIWVGGKDALKALETVSVVAGLPYTVIVCFMCVALWRALKFDCGQRDPYGPQFSVGYFDIIARPSCRGFGLLLANIFIAPYTFARAMVSTGKSSDRKRSCLVATYTVILALLLIASIVLQICTIWVEELWSVAVVFFLSFVVAGGGTRLSMRNKFHVDGNLIEDMFSALIYPVLAYQLWQMMRSIDELRSKYDVPLESLDATDSQVTLATPYEEKINMNGTDNPGTDNTASEVAATNF